jgi:hypothetical protein
MAKKPPPHLAQVCRWQLQKQSQYAKVVLESPTDRKIINARSEPLVAL